MYNKITYAEVLEVRITFTDRFSLQKLTLVIGIKYKS